MLAVTSVLSQFVLCFVALECLAIAHLWFSCLLFVISSETLVEM
jgi:hypothetical protein